MINTLLDDDSWVTTPAGRGRQLLREAVLVDSQGSHKVRWVVGRV